MYNQSKPSTSTSPDENSGDKWFTENKQSTSEVVASSSSQLHADENAPALESYVFPETVTANESDVPPEEISKKKHMKKKRKDKDKDKERKHKGSSRDGEGKSHKKHKKHRKHKHKHRQHSSSSADNPTTSSSAVTTGDSGDRALEDSPPSVRVSADNEPSKAEADERDNIFERLKEDLVEVSTPPSIDLEIELAERNILPNTFPLSPSQPSTSGAFELPNDSNDDDGVDNGGCSGKPVYPTRIPSDLSSDEILEVEVDVEHLVQVANTSTDEANIVTTVQEKSVDKPMSLETKDAENVERSKSSHMKKDKTAGEQNIFAADDGSAEEQDDDDEINPQGDTESSEQLTSSSSSSTDYQKSWEWAGKGVKRTGKRRLKKEFFKSIRKDKRMLNIGDCAVFKTVGNQLRPYIGRIQSFWEATGGNWVKVNWFYHPEETCGFPDKLPYANALFESPHVDVNDVQTIVEKCDVLTFDQYRSRVQQNPDLLEEAIESTSCYYLAGNYDPTNKRITFAKGVI